MECFVPLYPPDEWPKINGHRRTKEELIRAMNEDLSRNLVGISWDFSQMIRDNVMESLSGVKGENSVKIIGPELDETGKTGRRLQQCLGHRPRRRGSGRVPHPRPIESGAPGRPRKCAVWSVSVADVEDVIQTAVGGKPFTRMVEGERSFDVTLRWPKALRQTEEQILDIPVDVVKNNVTINPGASAGHAPLGGTGVGLSAIGTSVAMPSLAGSSFSATDNSIGRVPRRRLGDLVTPADERGIPDPHGKVPAAWRGDHLARTG